MWDIYTRAGKEAGFFSFFISIKKNFNIYKKKVGIIISNFSHLLHLSERKTKLRLKPRSPLFSPTWIHVSRCVRTSLFHTYPSSPLSPHTSMYKTHSPSIHLPRNPPPFSPPRENERRTSLPLPSPPPESSHPLPPTKREFRPVVAAEGGELDTMHDETELRQGWMMGEGGEL